MTRSEVFLTNLQVFHLLMKYCVECLILLLIRTRNKDAKNSAVFDQISKHSLNINFLCIFYELLMRLRRSFKN